MPIMIFHSYLNYLTDTFLIGNTTFTTTESYTSIVGKMSANGNIAWAKHLKGSQAVLFDIRLDYEGNILTYSSISDTSLFYNQTDLGSGGSFNRALTLKINPANGNIIWNYISSTINNNAVVYALTVDKFNDIYLSTAITASDNITDAYINKRSGANGNTIWSNRAYGDIGNTFIWALDMKKSGALQTVGMAGASSLSFNPASSNSVLSIHSLVAASRGYEAEMNCNYTPEITSSGNVLTASVAGARYQWINCVTNTPMPGDTNRSFAPAANGRYAVAADNNGCVVISNCINFTSTGGGTTSLNELTKKHLTIFPNPASTAITIADIKPGTRIIVSDITGKQLITTIADQAHQTISTSALINGIYVVQIEKDGTISQQKLVINK